MAAQRGLRFEDIIKAQQRMAAQGDPMAAKMIEKLEGIQKTLDAELKLSEQDRLLQAAQVYQEYKADKDDDRIVVATEKGLLEKEGDALNANVIKLTDVIRESTLARPKVSQGGPAPVLVSPAEPIEKESKEVAGALRASDRFIPAGFNELMGNIKKLGSLEGWFDTKTRDQGMLGRAIAFKAEQNQFVRDEQAAGSTASVAELKQNFKEVNNTIREQQKTQADIKRLEEKSFTRENSKELSRLYERKETLERRRESTDPRIAREKAAKESLPSTQKSATVTPIKQKEQEVKVNVETNVAAPLAPLDPKVPALFQKRTADSVAPAPIVSPIQTTEEEAEASRMEGEQLSLLQQIEANTRPQQSAPNAPASEKPVEAQPEKKGGLISSALSAASFIPGPVGMAARAAKAVSGFFGFKAVGGPVAANQPYMVGERGPEVVVPESAGKVIPSGQSQVIDMGGGVLKKINSDGSYSISGAEGTKKYDASGALIESQSPKFAGYQETTRADGSVTRSQEAGPLAVSQTTDASTNIVSQSSSYDMGVAKVSQTDGSKSIVMRGGDADTIYNQSEENAGMASQPAAAAQAPVVINSPTNIQQTSNYAPKSPPRNTESSYQQYNRSRFA